MRVAPIALGLALVTAAHAAGPEPAPLEAVTVDGEKVRLFPNGRWEYLDAAKAETARWLAAQYPENRTRPETAQGGIFGVGKLLMPGDKDYNRGSLNPKLR